MRTEQLRAENGQADLAEERGPRAGAMEPEGVGGLGDLAKDAIEHLKVIVNDSVEIGKLEARKLAVRAEEIGRELAPRIAVGALAALVGLAGVVLALVALFITLGDVIPSVAARLAIFAATFLVAAAAGGFYALRPKKERSASPLVHASQMSR